MKRIGIWIIVLAIGSAVLPLFDLQFILLQWVDHWGPALGWVIRGALVALALVGALLLRQTGHESFIYFQF